MDLLRTKGSYITAACAFAEIISVNKVSDWKVQQHSRRTVDKHEHGLKFCSSEQQPTDGLHGCCYRQMQGLHERFRGCTQLMFGCALVTTS